MVSLHHAYIIGDAIFFLVWLPLFLFYKNTRQEILIMGLLIGGMSVITAYYWWTIDWWHPQTITGTRVGIEDFLTGFFSGGIRAVVYEDVFNKKYVKRKNVRRPRVLTLMVLLALVTSLLFWGAGFTSFWSATIALVAVAIVLFYYRPDLVLNGVMSGTLMAAIALLPYYVIMALSPTWIVATYDFKHLSGIEITGIPVEELIFWFLAGLVFGPFYEYWQNEKLRRVKRTH